MRWVEFDDVRLAVFEEGDPGHPTILLVHGYPDTHRVWDEVAERLRDRFHVVRYDVRGAGDSTAPRHTRDYALHRLAGDLAAVLDAIGKPRVHLVGHDWGSLQGWDAVTRPGIRDRIASFTSFGGPGLAQARHFMRHGRRRDVLSQAAKSWYIGAFRLPVLPELAWSTFMPRVLERSMRRGEGLEPRPGHPAGTLRSDARNGLHLYRSNMAGGGDVGGPSVAVPVQLIEATRDPFVSPALLASLGQGVPEFWHRKIAAGHWVQRSHPDVIARMIAEFAGHADGGAPTRSLRGARVEEGRKAFHGQLVVITGAGSGIGRATARAFAAHGAEVVCADLDREAAARTADGIAKDLGGTAHAVRVDVADPAQMEDFAGNIRAEHGVPDIVVNNAGIAVSGPFLDHSLDDWRRTLDVNLWGVIHGCRLFAAQMVERGEGGHIINIASAAAFVPSRLLPAYSTSKAAVKMLSDCLRAELAGQGIGVSVICPGFVSTPIARNATYVGPDMRESAERGLARRGYPPERVAAHILRAVHRDQAVVPVNAEGKIGYALSRISPGALRRFARVTSVTRNPPFAR
ncbi:SDR family oxidoreductase [Nonomuraea aurantiaca]|uniref:SDR family oxidoreductase n=1 Tax=Nonomuraea aurantiaca TaxID=2878562 RepID=UPI001CDA204E|nr:SDR family oxidoreductase [Nonomuraea aurantiaca]MCA2227130.1 SDR family oxidoreductase [Nonomuraea aurantiaca]